MQKILFSVLTFFVFLGVSFSQIHDPVSWTFSAEQNGSEATLISKATIEKGWHVYSQYLESEFGPVPTEFIYDKSDNYSLDGKTIETKKPTVEFDKNFDMNVAFFSDEITFKQKIKILSATDFTLKGSVGYMVCDDEKCLPPTDELFEFKLKGAKGGVKLNPVTTPTDNLTQNSVVELTLDESKPKQTGILDPVQWSFSSNKISDTEYEIIATATIQEHWHVYATKLESNDGPVPTQLTLNENKEIELVGEVVEVGNKKNEYDENFMMQLQYYENKLQLKQKIKFKNPIQTVSGTVNFMVCDAEQCLPPMDIPFEVDLTKSGEVTTTAKEEISGDCQPKTFEGNVIEKEDESYLWFFITAFLFGLTTLLTPCVFPMIPMTVSFFMKDEGKGKRNAFFYGLSIIFIYTFIGTIVSVVFGASFSNWLATHWIPNVIFFLVFVIFAASFFGMFEITMPSWLVSKTDKGADRGGLIGVFFMALTLVVVSFSCTGPIVGIILIKASQGAVLEPMIGMLGFSLAFALPFTLFAIFPSMLNKLPQSGGWLNSVKVVLGFLELALALKFLSVADQTYHWGILDRHVYIALWIVIFGLMGLYLLGKITFSHDSPVKFLSVPRLMLAIVVLSFTVYLVPGMFGAPLKELSGYLPPMSTHDFNLLYEEGEMLCDEEPKYADFLHLPHGLKGYFDYEQGMACAKANNKPVFIDFTGHGCVNCRKMEANVWSDERVLKLLREEFVVIALYCDDKTPLLENEWYESKFDGRMKKTIGAKNLDFQICSFNNNAQPLYVLLDNEGELVNNPKGYDTDVNAFYNFLKEGIKNYKAKNISL